MQEYPWLDATAEAELIRAGEIVPTELVEVAIARIEEQNARLNAVIHPLFDKARAQVAQGLPNGSFHGVPIVLKDLVSTSAGDPYHCGMRVLREAGWTEREDSESAARLRAAGFVFVGRTNTPELGLMPTTEPEAYGPTRNPWNTDHSTGGSSGGSAAAVAAGMVSVAHATDGGGSIRIPASECGLVGLKPSRGRTSGRIVGPAAGILGVEGVLTRSVRDTAAILDVLASETPARPLAAELDQEPGRLRVGLMTSTPGGMVAVQDDCSRAARETAHLLEELGHVVEESHPAPLDELEHIIHFGALTGADTLALLDHWSARIGRTIGQGDVEPNTWMIAEMGRGITAEQLATTMAWMGEYEQRVVSWWQDFDLLLTPTLPEPPPRIGDLTGTPENPLAGGIRGGMIAAFTPVFNTTGQPAISLPLHWNDAGLPVGVQLIAAPGREDLLIRIAAQLERARPWTDRRPPTV
ncbi:MAG: amidase [Actinomycetota bacterium]